MPSQTRGAIEEGLSQFTHDTEKDIVFEGADLDKAGFNGPPVVKLISASRYPPTLLSNQKDLLFNSTQNFVPTYTTAPSSLAESGPFTVTTTNTTIKGGFAGTLNNASNLVNKGFRLTQNADTVTIPFDNSKVRDDSLIQVFFQARFTSWENDAADDTEIYFVNETQVEANNDGTPTDAADLSAVKYSLFMNKAGDWRAVTNRVNVDKQFALLESQELDDIDSTFSSGGLWHWLRLDITKATSDVASGPNHKLTSLKAFSFRHSPNSGEGSELLEIADLSVFVWDGGVARWDASHNYLGTEVSHLTQANIGVTFTNVTTEGMKIQTTAPFTGWIRYLCSVQG